MGLVGRQTRSTLRFVEIYFGHDTEFLWLCIVFQFVDESAADDYSGLHFGPSKQVSKAPGPQSRPTIIRGPS